jgi:hypothetical protein
MASASWELTEGSKNYRNSCKELQHCNPRRTVCWYFIPPNSLHFGGFWEVAVKSVKYHLKSYQTSALLFEECKHIFNMKRRLPKFPSFDSTY